MTGDGVRVDLTADEALVLYDWLARFNQRRDVEFQDQAEQRVLWDIEAVLEATLVEPFRDEYASLVSAARNRVRDPIE